MCSRVCAELYDTIFKFYCNMSTHVTLDILISSIIDKNTADFSQGVYEMNEYCSEVQDSSDITLVEL